MYSLVGDDDDTVPGVHHTIPTTTTPTDDVAIITKVKSVKSFQKLFKTMVPTELFYNFIKKIAYKLPNSNHYLIDVSAYKKATYCDEPQSTPSLLQEFCNDLIPYYCKDKHFFLTRKMSYNNLNTILRQVCRHNNIECNPNRKYDKSKTQIVYYISCEDNNP
jgi:hypothetical protein